MIVEGEAISLGIKEGKGGVFDGKKVEPYEAFCYSIKGETEARRHYIDSENLALRHKMLSASVWGTSIVVRGDMDAKGRLKILDLKIVNPKKIEVEED